MPRPQPLDSGPAYVLLLRRTSQYMCGMLELRSILAEPVAELSLWNDSCFGRRRRAGVRARSAGRPERRLATPRLRFKGGRGILRRGADLVPSSSCTRRRGGATLEHMFPARP